MVQKKLLLYPGALELNPNIIDGRRITDPATLEIVTMVYGGLFNKRIVAKLQASNCNAIGLTGADGNSIQSIKRPVKTIDYGLVGDIERVNNAGIQHLLKHQFTPVFCALTHDKKGQLLNTNADTIASSIAVAMAQQYEVQLCYCFEKKGVLSNPADDESFLHTLDHKTYKTLLQEGIISEGMMPKLENAFRALEHGVATVTLGNVEAIEGISGTTFTIMTALKTDAIELLKSLIATPSFSREEDKTAAILIDFLEQRNIPYDRKGNNIWAKSQHWRKGAATYLLNSHHDTVKPAKGWQRDPFSPNLEDGKLYGLGSNDAGASLVSLLATFLHFYNKERPFNLIFAASAEEEISGKNGIESLLPELGHIDAGIIGEPTQMQMAIAEKGLMVIDGEAKGKAGHAARKEGINALYIALEDITILRELEFEKTSAVLEKVKVSITQIEAGTQHNVVPDSCRFVIDVRTNDAYSNQEVFDILQARVQSTLKARSFRLNSSRIALEHPFVQSGIKLGRSYFGSPTLSDQALMRFPTLKMGCGDSARSHTADEFIYLQEIEEGIDLYIQLLENLSE